MEKHVSAFREYFAKETGVPCVMNIWIGGWIQRYSGRPYGPRMRYKDSIEQIIAEPHDPKLVNHVWSLKGIRNRVESYTADQPSLH